VPRANVYGGGIGDDPGFVGAAIIISYDGTANDDDALALGMALGATGASLALAYVRHSPEFDPRREELARHDANRRLALGAQQLGDGAVAAHVVLDASTPDGLERLAHEQTASVIVFGSDYRTAPGHAEPGNTAQRLIEGGSIAIAVAATGLRTGLGAPISMISVSAHDPDGTARLTAEALSAKLGAAIVPANSDPVDLIVVASQPSAPAGTIALGGATRAELNAARGSVLVLPSATSLHL
jgi:nucleotide-binding universal stress UspA family protein